tara:strand:+ start:506 stop:730 length:225 start_codon:yes stop_codon:yes gene_type:complete
MQTRLTSLMEVGLNVLSGFVLAWATTIVVLPMFLPIEEVKAMQSFKITVVFTIISITRGYIWRRVFNNKLKEKK